MPINSRQKGAAAERQLINELTEWLGPWVKETAKRNLEQWRNGGHDIVGLGDWAVEVKRYKSMTESQLRKFWQQAVDQAKAVHKIPVLAYRLDHKDWRVRIPMAHLREDLGDMTVEWTVEISVEAFAALVRETIQPHGLIASLDRGNENKSVDTEVPTPV